MEYKPKHFIGEQIEVQFDKPSLYSKKPGCPDRIVWKDQTFQITEKLAEWQDFSRSGRMEYNMRPPMLPKPNGEVPGAWADFTSGFKRTGDRYLIFIMTGRQKTWMTAQVPGIFTGK